MVQLMLQPDYLLSTLSTFPARVQTPAQVSPPWPQLLVIVRRVRHELVVNDNAKVAPFFFILVRFTTIQCDTIAADLNYTRD